MASSGPWTTFEVSRLRELFQTTRIADTFFLLSDLRRFRWAGQRFLINATLESEGPPPISVVLNWQDG